jgi:fimbrial chaperone protein
MKKIHAALLLFLLSCGGAAAASLQVSPVRLEVVAPGAAVTVTLHNSGARTLSTQARIYRWTQDGDEDRLEPTEDVVVSPPAAELEPGQSYIVRVVRVASGPVQGEETYRLLVDELPEESTRARAVNLVLRQSIPVLFDAADATAHDVSWSVSQEGRFLVLKATNAGDRRFRLSSVRIRDASGKTILPDLGRVAYVLGRSTMRWKAPMKSAPRLGGNVRIDGVSEEGPFSAQATVNAAH